jgi:hypothetical protein
VVSSCEMMNPIYGDEIQRDLEQIGVAAEIIAV